MSTVGNALSTAAEALAGAGIDTARLDAEVLLANAMDVSRAALLARLRDPFEPPARARFEPLLERRRQREPLAYIVGGCEFWSLWFEVTPQTLVPRPETEVLVENVLEGIAIVAAPRILDVGTGSGCIAVALAHERRDARVTAVDVSNGALAVARRNAELHGVSDRVDFRAADARRLSRSSRYDVIVANPPYIRRDAIEALQPEVSRWEPRDALDGGEDGLDLVRAVLAIAGELLQPGGLIALEIGSGQGDEAIALARQAGFADACVRADYAGLPRVLLSPSPQSREGSRRGRTLSALQRAS